MSGGKLFCGTKATRKNALCDRRSSPEPSTGEVKVVRVALRWCPASLVYVRWPRALRGGGGCKLERRGR
jgi:hypothetical protein